MCVHRGAVRILDSSSDTNAWKSDKKTWATTTRSNGFSRWKIHRYTNRFDYLRERSIRHCTNLSQNGLFIPGIAFSVCLYRSQKSSHHLRTSGFATELPKTCAFQGSYMGHPLVTFRVLHRSCRRIKSCICGYIEKMVKGLQKQSSSHEENSHSLCLNCAVCQARETNWCRRNKNRAGESCMPAQSDKGCGRGVPERRKIWIPSDFKNLKLRIIMEAHCGNQGHRWYDATLSKITGT